MIRVKNHHMPATILVEIALENITNVVIKVTRALFKLPL